MTVVVDKAVGGEGSDASIKVVVDNLTISNVEMEDLMRMDLGLMKEALVISISKQVTLCLLLLVRMELS